MHQLYCNELSQKMGNKKKNAISSEYLIAAKAIALMGISRHSFEKLIKNMAFQKIILDDKVVYRVSEIEAFMQTDDYKNLVKGVVDKRNKINDLSGKEWLPETKSYFYQKGLGADHKEAQIEKQHPAPFSFQDIEKLILFFTKKGMRVLDPFGGVASTAKACELTGRFCTSIELTEQFHKLSLKRLEEEVGKGTSIKHTFIKGDSCELLPTFQSNSIDFVVTSPPYWGILNKQDQKVKKGRVAHNLATKYSDDKRDLGNIADYNEFLDILCNQIFLQCARILKHGKYMAIVVSDFRDKGDFVSFHSDLIQRLNKAAIPEGEKLYLQGVKILIQNHKSLLPYGYPFSYVENIHHQYVLIFQKK